MSDKSKVPVKVKFPFEIDIKARFKKWTGLMNPEIEEALKELTGDTYFEMRKLISQLLTKIEQKIENGEYCGYTEGRPLTEDQKKDLLNTKEELKEFIKATVEETWRSILTKQKIGIDKLSLSIKPYITNFRNNETD